MDGPRQDAPLDAEEDMVIIYNRVPKTASTSFTNIAYDLCAKNKYHVLHINTTKNNPVMSLQDQSLAVSPSLECQWHMAHCNLCLLESCLKVLGRMPRETPEENKLKDKASSAGEGVTYIISLEKSFEEEIKIIWNFSSMVSPYRPSWTRLEFSGRILAYCNFHHVGPSDSLVSISQVARITGMSHHTRLIFCILVETGFYHVALSNLKLLSSCNPPSSASQSIRITGMSHHARLILLNAQIVFWITMNHVNHIDIIYLLHTFFFFIKR
ncbi:Heparan sulfate 2-O-sulfotransferase 1, partial [Plecturocebus cupreus]